MEYYLSWIGTYFACVIEKTSESAQKSRKKRHQQYGRESKKGFDCGR